MDDGGDRRGVRSILIGYGAGAPSLVRMHIQWQCSVEATSVRHCCGGGSMGAKENDTTMAQRHRGRPISLLLRWAGTKSMTTAEYGSGGDAKVSIWPVTCGTEVAHNTPRPMARSLPYGA